MLKLPTLSTQDEAKIILAQAGIELDPILTPGDGANSDQIRASTQSRDLLRKIKGDLVEYLDESTESPIQFQ